MDFNEFKETFSSDRYKEREQSIAAHAANTSKFEDIVPLNPYMIDQTVFIEKKKQVIDFVQKQIDGLSISDEKQKKLIHVLMDIKETLSEEVRLMEARRGKEKYVADGDNKDILTKVQSKSNNFKGQFNILNNELKENKKAIKNYIEELKNDYPEIYLKLNGFRKRIFKNVQPDSKNILN